MTGAATPARRRLPVVALVAALDLLLLWPLAGPLPGGEKVLTALAAALLTAIAIGPVRRKLFGLDRRFRRSERAQRAALVVSSLLLAVGGLELLAGGLSAAGLVEPYSAMRTMLPAGVEDWRLAHLTADRHREPDPELLWRPADRPPYNRQRYKGPVIARAKPPGVLRIFCYGDSNTDGPDRGGWPELLGERLAAAGLDAEVVNAGVAGYSSHQGLLRLRRDAPRYRPDLVLVSFGWNDLAPALGEPDKSYRPPAPALVAVQRLLVRYDLFRVARRYWPRGEPPVAGGQRVALADYHANLRGFAELAAEHGGRAVLLTRPHRESEPELRARHGSWRRNVPLYNRAVRRQAGYRGAVLIDVQRRFAGRPELFVDECHFNRRGQRRMAELVGGRLAQRGLLGRGSGESPAEAPPADGPRTNAPATGPEAAAPEPLAAAGRSNASR